MNALTKLLVTLSLFALALSACAPAVAQAGQNTPTVVNNTQPSPTTPPDSSPTPVADTPAPTSYVPTGIPDGGAPNVITLDYNNQLVTLHPDETFLLKLGEGYMWNLAIDDQAVISRIPNISVIRGAQGIYKAHQPGNATLTAQGDPLCRQSKPACGMPSVMFTLHIEVLK
jgi:hypothetical protein